MTSKAEEKEDEIRDKLTIPPPGSPHQVACPMRMEAMNDDGLSRWAAGISVFVEVPRFVFKVP